MQYQKPMPDIDSLMQVWPEEIEAILSQVWTLCLCNDNRFGAGEVANSRPGYVLQRVCTNGLRSLGHPSS